MNRRSECPRWEAFLRELFHDDQELIAFAQRVVGYAISVPSDFVEEKDSAFERPIQYGGKLLSKLAKKFLGLFR
jgi:hypothetical protein